MIRLQIILFLLSASVIASAQDPEIQERKVLQFTGVVFGTDSTSVIPGVHVYVPKAGRGTTTNPYGFFSMPTLEGDSIIFSAIGYKRSYYVVPRHNEDQSLKIIITLEEDVTYLEEVEVFPYPSEEMFKSAVLAAELPNQRDYDNLEAWLGSEIMQKMYWNLPASPNMNHRFFMNQYLASQTYRYQPPSNPLLNPFAWSTLIKSLK
ncbi:MAG: carboxypeptidase-like regulatory domain-containing protein [Cyclobacteriaceae bacterium]|nr:carboxypeptidase-like regulatory domain-containing protein [Cyclobacteriaceae bacterium HetDA_MAG_MS6]